MTNVISGKKIILGVTGSIAAYKAVDVASKLTQAGAIVTTILTVSAQRFVTPLTFQSVTGQRAYTDNDLWGNEGHVTHVGLGHTADLILIAPATATTIARLASGLGDNLLSLTALTTQCPLIIAPAMDAGMFSHQATTNNVEVLKKRGALFVGPGYGHLASGLSGLGRLIDTSEIIGSVRLLLGKKGRLAGRKVVVTCGPTQEPVDPVRFISNRSSGKQGLAIAQAAIDEGANVVLIHGPINQEIPYGSTKMSVHSTQEMCDLVVNESKNADALIMAAAPADFRPIEVSQHKIKKDTTPQNITLERTIDILTEISRQKVNTGFPKKVIGFAAESQSLIEYATKKLNEKHLDMIVANNILAPDSGFEVDTNRVSLIFPDGQKMDFPLKTKHEIAEVIIDKLCYLLSLS